MKAKTKCLFYLVCCFGFLARADACPVCFQSGGEERWAFYATTVFLTFLPLLMVGVGVHFLKKRMRQMAAGQEA